MTYDPQEVFLYILVTNKTGVVFNKTIPLADYPKWVNDRLVESVEVLRVAVGKQHLSTYIKSLESKRSSKPKVRQRTRG
jgi:hypothetical protein